MEGPHARPRVEGDGGSPGPHVSAHTAPISEFEKVTAIDTRQMFGRAACLRPENLRVNGGAPLLGRDCASQTTRTWKTCPGTSVRPRNTHIGNPRALGSRPGPWLVGAWRVPGPGRAGSGQLVVHGPEFLFGMIKSFWDSSWWVLSSGNGLGATQLPTARRQILLYVYSTQDKTKKQYMQKDEKEKEKRKAFLLYPKENT